MGADANAKRYTGRTYPMARFDAFVRECCRPADYPQDWMSVTTLYAHYRRWAYLNEMRPMARDTFVTWLKKNKRPSTELNGYVFYKLGLRWGNDGWADRDKENEEVLDRIASKVVKGKVRVTEDLNFVDGVLKAGTVLDYMTPSRLERRDLSAIRKRQIKEGNLSPVPWIVVMWKGQRRLVPGDVLDYLQ